MSEYALYKGRPVKKARAVAGMAEVVLFDGNRLFAGPLSLEDIEKPEYDRLVKEELAEKERLSKKDGLGSCEFLAFKRHGTGAAQQRGR